MKTPNHPQSPAPDPLEDMPAPDLDLPELLAVLCTAGTYPSIAPGGKMLYGRPIPPRSLLNLLCRKKPNLLQATGTCRICGAVQKLLPPDGAMLPAGVCWRCLEKGVSVPLTMDTGQPAISWCWGHAGTMLYEPVVTRSRTGPVLSMFAAFPPPTMQYLASRK